MKISSAVKFCLIARIFDAILFEAGFFLGWGQSRTKFANECITIGNFTVFDYGTDKHRKFKCTEVPFEEEPTVDNRATKLKASYLAGT